jgi:hypothetical protein
MLLGWRRCVTAYIRIRHTFSNGSCASGSVRGNRYTLELLVAVNGLQ